MRTVVKSYQFKLYQSDKNKYLDECIDIAADVWNYCVAAHRCYYRLYGKSLSRFDLGNHVTKLRRRRFKKWQKLNAQAVQDVVRRVDVAYSAFFKHVKEQRSGKKSLPHFKKKKDYTSFTMSQNGYRFVEGTNTVIIMKRRYKYWKSREIDGTIKTLTVKRTPLGEFFIVAVVEQVVNSVLPRGGKAVGMDFGLKHFLTLSDGRIVDSPEWYKQHLRELQSAHRALSRCQKGSNHWRQAKLHLNRIYEKVSNSRKDWFFKLAHELTAEYATICIEDLNFQGMQRRWGRKIGDVAGAEFVSILEWVASNVGCTIVKIGRWEASTKVCHVCGCKYEDLTLGDREWVCPECGAKLDRDVNAAINIREIALKSLEKAS